MTSAAGTWFFRPEFAVAQQGGRVRREGEQRPHRACRFEPASGLQVLAQGDHGQQHGRGFIIQIVGAVGGHVAQEYQRRVPQAVQEGRARAHRHQGVHAGRLVQQGGNAA